VRHALVRPLTVAALVAALTSSVAPLAAGHTTDPAPPATSAPAKHVRPDRAERPQLRGRIVANELPGKSGSSPNGAPTGEPSGATGEIRLPSVVSTPAIDPVTTNASPRPAKRNIGATANYGKDAVVAVGPDDVVAAIGGEIRITNRQGGDVLLFNASELFGLPPFPATLDNGDVRVYFDEARGRWVAVEQSYDCNPTIGRAGHGYLDFAISDNANPRLGWSAYYFAYPDRIVSRPAYGNSTDKFVLTSHWQRIPCEGAENVPYGAEVIAMSWAEVLTGEAVAESFDVSSLEYVHPAVQEPITDSTAYVVGMIPAGGGEVGAHHFVYMTVYGTMPTVSMSSTNLTTANVLARKVGGAPGPTSAVWQSDRLVFSSTEECDLDLCARVTDLVTNDEFATRRQDFVIAKAGKDLHSPAVTFSGAGDIAITYLQTVPDVAGTAYIVEQYAADPLNSVTAPTSLVGVTTGARTNTGHLFGLARDPLVIGSAWVTSSLDVVSSPATTQVAQLTTATGDTYVPIAPVRILDTRPGIDIGLSDPFYNSVPRTFHVAGTGGGTIPSDAVAITANLTVTDQQSAGYVSVGPSITATPATSTINFPFGDTRANNLTLPLNADGDLMAVFKGPPGKFTNLILDVTGYFLADDSGATYQPITAVRKLDTRFGTGLAGRFSVNVPRSFQVSGGTVPADAVAVTGNLTVVGQSKAGYVSLGPANQANPTTSTINFPLGDTRANGVTVRLSATGKLWAVYKSSGGSTDLIFDVTGYYVDGTSGLRFFPLNPGRIMDTRFNTLTQLFGPFMSSTPRTLVTGGHFGVPSNALAVTGNLTVVGQTKAGYVSITKDPIANPAVSTINFPLGDVRANGVTVPLNSSNDMALVYKATSGAKTNLILDLTGYFR
jgi:hypothetical protein